MTKKKNNPQNSVVHGPQISNDRQTASSVASFSSDPPATFNPDVYTDDEISAAGSLVKEFFDGIVVQAPTGTHRVVSVSTVYADPAVIVFHKSATGTISAENTLHDSFTMMTAMVLRGGNFSSTLQSFINEDINDSAGLMQTSSAQEIRAWSVSMGNIYGLNSEEIADAYNRDVLNGKIADTPDNTSYLPAWNI